MNPTLKSAISGGITGLLIGIIASAFGIPFYVGFLCWMIGTINGIIITSGGND